VLEDDLSLDVPSGTVPREGYAAFRASSQRVDDAFFETTRYDTPLQVPSPHR
jgi:hypothetical protein